MFINKKIFGKSLLVHGLIFCLLICRTTDFCICNGLLSTLVCSIYVKKVSNNNNYICTIDFQEYVKSFTKHPQ